MPADPPPTPPRRKRRLPILVRHAISLGVVFVIALPLSYEIGRRVYRDRQLDKLESADRQTFEEGLAYAYNHVDEKGEGPIKIAAICKVLPPDRAAELFRVLVNGAMQDGDPYPTELIIAMVGDEVFQQQPLSGILTLYDDFARLGLGDNKLLREQIQAAFLLESDAEFLQAVDAFDARLLWSKDLVPRPAWVRWLSLLARTPGELEQHKAAKLIGELPDDLADPRIAQTLEQLSRSEHDSVRAQVLRAAAGYAAIADDPVGYEQVLFTLGGDANKVIARRAWMIVGHLAPLSGYAVNWRDADVFVAEAMLWAAVKTNPDRPEPAIEAILNAGLAAEGLLALGEAEGVTLFKLQHELRAGDLIGQTYVDNPDFKAAWRTILAIDPFAGDLEYWVVMLSQLGKFQPSALWTEQQTTEYGLQFRNRFFAMTYRFNEYYPPQGIALTTGDPELGELAAFEGLAISEPHTSNPIKQPQTTLAQLIAAAYDTHKIDVPALVDRLPLIEPATHDLLVLALLNAEPSVSAVFLRSAQRDKATLGAIAAGIRSDYPTLISGVTADFLREHPDMTDDQLHAMSDAELADFGLTRVDALATLLDIAENAANATDRDEEIAMLKLALWMRGDLGDGFTAEAEAMLFDDELPTSTVLMCLLHMKRPIALRYLFGDLVTPRPDLHELFIQRRWWHVLRRFVDTSDLTLWLWGDPAAQGFQIEAMRQWYAVNRWRIERGWWPDAIDD